VFVCDNCGHDNLALDKRNTKHTKGHLIVRVFGKVEKKGPSTEERLQLLEDKLAMMEGTLAGHTRTLAEQTQTLAEQTQTLAKQTQTLAEQTQTLAEVRQTLEMLAEKSAAWSPGESLAKGDLCTTVIEVGSGELEGEPRTAETT
jgi:uncharacterized coiled-coil protein SlyX